jgi:hypothetical protein
LSRYFVFLFFNLTISFFSLGQTGSDMVIVPPKDSQGLKDTTFSRDSLRQSTQIDSVSRMPLKNDKSVIDLKIIMSSQQPEWELVKHNPYFGFFARPSVIYSSVKRFTGKDALFYLLVSLLIICAFIKKSFPKYFNDLFRLFFRTNMKQRQIKEQLMQTPLPSLLLNGFFVISAGLYASFLLEHFKLNPFENFWLLYFYCCLGLSAVYFIKFLGLKMSGWLFNMQEASNSYIFIVFIINKMIGILILPFLIILAFSDGNIYTVSLALSWCLIAGLFLYRIILTFADVLNQVKVNPFHFFLYVCAFEIAPLFLIYKGLGLLFLR